MDYKNGIKKHMASLHKPTNGWFTNAIKSMGLSSGDLIKELSPSMYEFTVNTSRDAMSMSKDLRNQRISIGRVKDTITNSPYYKTSKDLLKNSLDDLKTGKFVNPEREKRMDDEFEKRFLGDMDGMFDDISFSDDDTDGATINNNVYNDNSEDSNATLFMTQAMQANSETQVKMTQATMDTMVSLASNVMMQTKQLGEGIIHHLGSINDNLAAMVEYNNENMTKFIEASLSYYEQTVPTKKDEYESNSKLGYGDILNSKGSLNMSQYGSYIKQNLKKSYSDSMYGGFIDLLVENPEMLLGSPLKMLAVGGMKTLVPKILSNSLKSLDNSFSNFFPTLLGKMSDWEGNENPLLSNIGRIAGAKEKRVNKFKLGDFERGAIPFDGITKHAIVEVIPMYLRKILSSISGKDETAFNWERGKYENVSDLKNSIYSNIKNTTLNEFKYSSNIDAKLSKNRDLLVESDAKKFDDLKDQFYLALEKSSLGHFNPVNKDKDEYKDIMENIDTLYGPQLGKFLRASFKTLSKEDIMSINSVRNNAKKSRRDTVEAMQYDPYYYGIYNLADDDTIDKEIGKREKGVSSVNNVSRKHKSETLNYLSDIKGILLRGINVRMQMGSPFDNQYANATPTVNSSPVDTDAEVTTPLSNDDKESRDLRGYYTESISNKNMSTNDMVDKINNKNYIENQDWMGDQIDPNQENTRTLGGKARNKLKGVATPLANSMNRTSDFIYGLLFGSTNQLFDTIAVNMADKLTRGFEWVKTKIFNPLKGAIIGEKDENGYMQSGILSHLQNSTKDFMNEAMRGFSGRGYVDKTGKKVEDLDPKDSVVGKVRSIFSTIKDDTMTYLFGKKDDETGERDKDGGLIKKASSSISDGFNDFRELLFGAKKKSFDKDGNEITKSFKQEIMEKMPKTVTGTAAGAAVGTVSMLGGTGLLGSLFLPGGPIAGAIVGSALGFVSQSEKFKEFVFGKDMEDGKHVEGIISKKTQEFYKENKAFIKGGAAFGLMKTALFGGGIMSNLMFGPFTGAVLGAGLGILKRSQTVQEILYGKGEEGEEGYKKGVINSIKEKLGHQDFKKALGHGAGGALTGFLSSAAIGKMGIIGSMLTPMGPLGGAILGGAIGIASTNEKVKDFLFGEMGDDNKRDGGLIGKVKNYVSIELFQPLKLKMQEMGLNVTEFLDRKLAEPVRRAIEPFAHQMKLVGETIKEKFVEIKDNIVTAISDTVVKPMAEGLNKYILDPLKNLSSKLFNGLFSVLGTLISAPFSLLSATTSGLVKNHKDRALDDERDAIWKRKDPNKGFMGNTWTNFKDTVKNYGTKGGREKAYANNAPYLVDYEEDIKKREAERTLLYDSKRENLEKEKEKYKTNQDYARSNGYLDINNENGIESDNNDKKKKKNRLWNMLVGHRKAKNEKEENREESRVRHNAPYIHNERLTDAANIERARVYDRINNHDYTTDATLLGENITESQGTGKKRRKKQSKKQSRKQRKRNNNNTPTGNIEFKSSNISAAETTTTTDATLNTPSSDTSVNDGSEVTSTNQIKTARGSVKGKKLPNYQANMLKYIKDIRDEVKGQLNGVGLNIFKIRKTLSKRLGVTDDGEEGSDNLEGVGILDKIGNFLQRPIKNITGLIMRPFRFVSETVGKIKQGFIDFWDGLKSIPGKIISGIGTAIKTTVSLVGDGLKFAGGLVRDTIGGILGITKGAIKGVGTMVSATMKGFTTVLGGISSAIGSIIGGIANGVGKVLSVVPELIGGTVEALGTIGAGLIKGIGHVGSAMLDIGNAALGVMSTAAKSVIGIIGKLGEATVKLITTPLKMAANAIGSVAGFIGDLFTGGRRNRQKIEFIGGKIDRIVEPVNIEGGNDKLVNVRIVEATTNVPVDLGDSGWKKIGDIIKKAIGGRSSSDDDSDDTTTPNGPKPLSGMDKIKKALSSMFGGGYREETIVSSGAPMPEIPQQDNDSSGLPNLLNIFSGLKGKIPNGLNPKSLFNKAKSLFGKNTEGPVKRTAAVEIAEKAKKKAVLVKDTLEKMKVNLLTRIDKSTEQHTFDWAYMFGKKGLVTAGLLAMLPLAYQLFKKLMNTSFTDLFGQMFHNMYNGFQNNGSVLGRTQGVISNALGTGDKDGDGFVDGDLNKDGNYSMLERVRQFYTGGDKDGDPDTVEVDHLTGAKLNATRGILSKTVNKVKKFGESKPIQSLGQYGKEKVYAGVKAVDNSKVLNTAFDKTKEFLSSNRVTKIIQMCKDAIDVVKTKLVELIAKMTKGAKGGMLEKVISKVVSTCLKPEIITKYLPKFGKVLAKGAMAAGTVALSEAVWFSVGAVDGAFTVSNLFQCDESVVDSTMTAIAAVFRGFLNTTVGSIIDIINEISFEILGFSFVTEMATMAYKAISSKEDGDKLQTSREEFMNQYKEYKDGEEDKAFQKYLDDNPDIKAELANNPNAYQQVKQDYIKNNPVDTMSVANFNEEKHQGFFKKASNTWNYGVKWAKQKFGLDTSEEDASLTNPDGTAKDGLFSNNLGKNIDNFGFLVSPWVALGNTVTKSLGMGTIGEMANTFVTNFHKSWDDIISGNSKGLDGLSGWLSGNTLNNDYIRKAFNLNDYEPIPTTYRISTGIASAISTITLGTIKPSPSQTDTAITNLSNNVSAAWENWNSFISSGSSNVNDWLAGASLNDDYIRKAFHLEDGEEITTRNRISTAIASNISILSFGTIKPSPERTDSAIGRIQKALGTMWDFLGKAMDSFIDEIKTGFPSVRSHLNKAIGSYLGLKDEDGNLISFTDAVSMKFGKNKPSTSVSDAEDDSSYQNKNKYGNGVGSIVSGEIADAKVGGGNTDVYYSQKEGPWAGMQYGTDKTMSDVGCGPTTAAMLISNVTGEKVTPDQTAKYAMKNGYLVNNKGTSWDYFNNVGNQYGVNMKQTKDFTQVESALSSGHPVVLTGNGGAPYTKGGHYIMAKGFDSNGNILVSDPLGKNRNTSYSPELLQSMTSQAWISDKGTNKSSKTGIGASVVAAGTNKITMGEAVVNSARKLVGLPYVYGGNVAPLGNSSGTDCSGLAQWAYNDALGKSIPRTTYTQLDGLTTIDGNNLQPGDLIYPHDGHVYMYAGDNKVIEAQKTGTKISEHDYDRPGSKFRRVLDNPNAYIDGSGSASGQKTRKEKRGGIDKSDTYGAISQFMSEYSERAYVGALSGKYNTDYDEFFNGKEVEVPISSSNNDASLYTPGSADDVASRLVDIIAVGEGDYNTVVPDDVDAFSFGIMGFHKEYAAEVLTRMANRLSGADADEARYYASLANGTLSASDAAGLRSFLNRASVKTISQEEQKKYAMELVKSRNLPKVLQMLKDGTLKDPRSAVLVADIGNTGPAHITDWASHYTPAASKEEELAHVRESLKSSDSYWGRQVNGGQSQYYQGWMNRIDKTYGTLANQSGGGEINPLDIPASIDMPKDLPTIQYGGGGDEDFSINPIFKSNSVSDLSSTIIQKVVKDTFKPTPSVDKSDKNYDLSSVENLLTKIASYLESISSTSTDSANTLRRLKITTDTASISNNNQSNNPIILNSGANQNNGNVGKVSKNEALARKIAKGLQ